MANIDIINGFDIQTLMSDEYQRYLNGEDNVKNNCVKNIIELSKIIQQDNSFLLELEKENNRERELEIKEAADQDRKEIEDRKLELESNKLELELNSKKNDRIIKCIEIGVPIATTIAGAIMTNVFLNKTMIFEANGNIYGRDVASKATIKMFDGFSRKISSIK